MKIRKVWVASVAMLLAISGCAEVTSEADPPSPQETTSQAQVRETPEDVETEEAVVSKEGTFKMAVFNYDSTSYPDMEVWVRGAGSWYPNADFGDTKTGFGPFAVGEELSGDFYIYPFGRGGIEVPVTILLQDDHISESDRDQVWIWIEDGVLVVTGTPVLQDIELPLN